MLFRDPPEVKTHKGPRPDIEEASARTGKVFDPQTDQYVTPGKKPKMTGDENLDYDWKETPDGWVKVPGSEGAFYRFGEKHKDFIDKGVSKMVGGKKPKLVSDKVLAKAYDEVFFQKPSSGDYKYDADVLSDSIAEQLGKESLDDFSQDQQTEIYNTALKRVTDDMKMKRTLEQVEQKMKLSDFDVTDRKPNTFGGGVGSMFRRV
jgi:hypothetical protein